MFVLTLHLAAFESSPLNNSKAMKKFYLFQNSLLPLLGALAVMCAGSCSQEILEVPEDLMPETRAASLPQVNISCDPLGIIGPNGQYFAKDRIYTFNVLTFVPIGWSVEWTGTDITVEAIDGSDDAIDILLQSETSVKLRFTDVGVYRVHVKKWYFDNSQDPAPIMNCEATQICRVPSAVSSIDGPGSVILGGEYNFKVNFTNPDYPDPTLSITESVFNDPKYTIISNDGAGNYRIRFDQPGDYKIKPGLGVYSYFSGNSYEMNGPVYYVKAFFRPEMRFSRGELRVSGEGIEDTLLSYLNFIELCDIQHIKYTSLPFRVFFKYSLSGFIPTLENQEPIQVPDIHGEVRQLAGMGGDIMLPNTTPDVPVRGLYYADESSLFSRRGYYWKITIPRDTCYYWDGTGQSLDGWPTDPDSPFNIIPTD